MSFLDGYDAKPGIAGVRFVKKHRTQAEIAEAHAKAADDLFRAIYPTVPFPTNSAVKMLEDVGPERYFSDWVPWDAKILQEALNKQLDRLNDQN